MVYNLNLILSENQASLDTIASGLLYLSQLKKDQKGRNADNCISSSLDDQSKEKTRENLDSKMNGKLGNSSYLYWILL